MNSLMLVYGIIYRVTNLSNGKIYIGQTINSIPIRQRVHYHECFTKQKDTYFYRALKKYGKQHFKWDIVQYCSSKPHLNKSEVFWIKVFRSNEREFGYNMTAGGNGGDTLSNHHRKMEIISYVSSLNIGRMKSEETCKKLSNALKGRIVSDYARSVASLTHKGKKLSESHMKILREQTGKKNPFYGKTHTPETIEKIKAVNIGRKPTPEQRENHKRAMNTPEHRKKMSILLKGKTFSDEINKKKGRSGEENGNYIKGLKSFGLENLDRAMILYLQGLSVHKIARILSRSHCFLRNYIKRIGLPPQWKE